MRLGFFNQLIETLCAKNCTIALEKKMYVSGGDF